MTAEHISQGGEQFIRCVRICFIVWRGQTGCQMKRLYLSGLKCWLQRLHSPEVSAKSPIRVTLISQTVDAAERKLRLVLVKAYLVQ